MNLISLESAIFFLSTLLIYYIIPIKQRLWVLLIASITYLLLCAAQITIIYLLFSIISIYFASRYIENSNAKYRKHIFVITIICNVALLASQKYINGLWSTGQSLLAIFGLQLPDKQLNLPVVFGISFYTLTLIGYLTDIYRGVIPAQKNPGKLALFASYFPAIGSGPILRYNETAENIFKGSRADYRNITFGMQRILWGLFKKLVIAERMAMITGPVFQDTGLYPGAWMWLGMFAALILVYTDFSGNIDIILGISECFGIKLPDNFKQPFFSRTFQEFWQRWHITLGLWLRDYIMYPLLRSKSWIEFGKSVKKRFGKNTARLLPLISAMLILWLANGLWHGGNLNFFFMAIWWWFALVMGQLLEPSFKKITGKLKINTGCFIWRLFQRIRTAAVYSVGVLFFFSPSVSDAFGIIKRAFHKLNFFDLSDTQLLFTKASDSDNTQALTDTVPGIFDNSAGIIIAVLSIFILFFIETKQNNGTDIRLWLSRQNLVFRWAMLLGLIYFIVIFGIYGPGYNAADFIYAGF